MPMAPDFIKTFFMQRQKQILEVFIKSDKEVLTKSEIIDLGQIWYYHGTERHVGNTLSRMVKNNLLKQTKKGYYKMTGRTAPSHGKETDFNPNQTQLFNHE